MSDLSDFGLLHRTDVAYRRLRAEIREHVASLDSSDEQSPTDMLQMDRRLMILAQQLKIMSVVKARVVHDYSWAEIAEALKIEEAMARKIYGDAEKRWLSGDPRPWMPRVATVLPLLRRMRRSE